jgi:hypothetical protein
LIIRVRLALVVLVVLAEEATGVLVLNEFRRGRRGCDAVR